jgi:hypothetical protein
VLVVVIIGVAAFFVLSPTSSNSTSSFRSTATSSTTGAGASTGAAVAVLSDNLTVGFQAGTWQIKLQNSGTKTISEIEVVLSTPTQTVVCTGTAQSGMAFANCPATVSKDGPLAPGGTITGFASGIGAGSAKAGSTYPLTINVVFSDATKAAMNSTVTATAIG